MAQFDIQHFLVGIRTFLVATKFGFLTSDDKLYLLHDVSKGITQ